MYGEKRSAPTETVRTLHGLYEGRENKLNPDAMRLEDLLAQRKGGLVSDQDNVGMQLENGSGAAGGNGSINHIMNGLGLLLTVSGDHDGTSAHDGVGTHGIGLTRDILDLIEKAAVGLDRALGKVDAMSAVGEVIVGLVEANVTVVANAQKLKILVARSRNHGIVLGASGISIGIGAIGHMGILDIDVHVIEQVLVHEITVALGVITVETAILVQVIAAHLGEVNVALLVPLDKLLVRTNGSRAGSQAKNAIRLENNLRRDDIGNLAAHILIVANPNDPDHA